MNRLLLVIIGLLLAISSYGQKVKRIETKLIISDQEGQNDIYSSVDFEENDRVSAVKTPWRIGYQSANTIGPEQFPLALLAIDLGAAVYPLTLDNDWIDEYRLAILGDCQNHADCQIDLMMDLDQVRLMSTTKQEMVEEIFDKFDDPNNKQPSEIITKHHLSYNFDGSIKQLKHEEIEGDVLISALLNQFIYDNNGQLTQYMSADINSGSRSNFTFIRENGRLVKVAWSAWNEKKEKWNRPSGIDLRYVSDDDQLHSATYTDDKGRQQYVQEFIYTYY